MTDSATDAWMDRRRETIKGSVSKQQLLQAIQENVLALDLSLGGQVHNGYMWHDLTTLVNMIAGTPYVLQALEREPHIQYMGYYVQAGPNRVPVSGRYEARYLTGLCWPFTTSRWPEYPDMFQTHLWPAEYRERWEPKMDRTALAALLTDVVNHFMKGE
jgi:hypothetical protein